MGNFETFSQGHPKAPFCEKVQRDDEGKFFKKSPKKWPSLQKPNSTLAQMALSSNQYPLIKTEQEFGAKSSSKTSRMTKLWQFSQRHPRPAFSKKVQRGDQEKFFKNRAKSSPRLKGPKALWRK